LQVSLPLFSRVSFAGASVDRERCPQLQRYLLRRLWGASFMGGIDGAAFMVRVALPIFAIFPLGAWLFGTLVRNQEHHYEIVEMLEIERTMLRTLIDNVPDYIFIKAHVQNEYRWTRAAIKDGEIALRLTWNS
jgi:hypothetical protein